jgi:hypothetical protein
VLCKSCNTAKGAAFAKVSRGRLTHQYNPTKGGGAANVGEWVNAVGAITPHIDRGDRGLVSTMSTRDAVDMIRATPQNKRRDFAAKLRRKNPATRENLFGWGKPVPVPARRGRTGGLSLSEASSAALKAGRKSADLSDFDSWLERKHLDTRSDAVISRLRDAYKRGVEKSEAAEQNREFLKDKREQAREAARDRAQQAREDRAQQHTRRRTGRSAPLGASSMPDEAAMQAGFKRGLSLADMMRANPGFKSIRPEGTYLSPEGYRIEKGYGSWHVTDRDGEPVETSKAKRIIARLEAALSKRKRNPATASAEAYERFHGQQSSEVASVDDELHIHEHLSAIGDLEKLKVRAPDGGIVTLTDFDGAILCQAEDGSQLYIRGGDQSVDLDEFAIEEPYHEVEDLGEVREIRYYTDKKHLGKQGGKATYFHHLGEEDQQAGRKARRPRLLYSVRDQLLSFAGGGYTIPSEGIRN